MFNKQFKIWFGNFLRAYANAPFLVRALVGAILGFMIFYIIGSRIDKPQKKELELLKRELNSIDAVENENLIVADLKNSQRKVMACLEHLRQSNYELGTEYGTLAKEETGKSLFELRRLFDQNELRIISEEKVIPSSEKKYSGKVYEHIELSLPDSLKCESCRFKVLGSYAHLQHFLLDVFTTKSLFFLNNIRITLSREKLIDRNLNSYQALQCEFEAHIPYKTGGE